MPDAESRYMSVMFALSTLLETHARAEEVTVTRTFSSRGRDAPDPELTRARHQERTGYLHCSE
jgi:hypothetical protein